MTGHLTNTDMQRWLDAVMQAPTSREHLLPWLEGPLRRFFPYKGLVLAHGELIAGQLSITHMLACGHEEAYLHQISSTFELKQRGSLKHWFSSRQPFYIDPAAPPQCATAFELDEIEAFELENVAGHGVLNIKSSAGTYFGFAGLKPPLGGWHLEALRLIVPTLNDLVLAHFSREYQLLHAPLQSLTPRQETIVRHLATGMGDKAIALALGISAKTVRNQLAAIYAKAGVNKRTQLLALLK